MAEAAESQQAIVGWEVGFLSLTVIFAGWAAWEARKAAQHTGKMLVAERFGRGAWLTVENFKVNDQIVQNKQVVGFIIAAEWVNSGETPALNVIPLAENGFRQGPKEAPFQPSDFEMLDQPAPANVVGASVGPGVGQILRFEISAENISRTIGPNPEGVILLIGRMVYNDVFRSKKVSEFCVTCEYLGDPARFGDPAHDHRGGFYFQPIGPRNSISYSQPDQDLNK
jgi:hypothetical protein